MNVSIVIPNYNGEYLLKKNFPDVIECLISYNKKKHVEIVIVDDASIDNSQVVLSNIQKKYTSEHISIKIIENVKNLGFSSTVNKGVAYSSGDIIVLLNTDVYPRKDFLSPLLSHFKDKDVFAVGCMDESIENGKIVQRGRGIGKWYQGFLAHRAGNIDKPTTLWVSGGSGAFRKTYWEQLGGLNELYNPFYWEDIDLSYRAHKAGYKVLFEPKSVVTHEHEKGAIKMKYSPIKITTVATRNQILFVWLTITDWDLMFSHILYLPYHMINAVRDKKWSFFKGLFAAFVLLPNIIQSRLIRSRIYKRNDKNVLEEFIE